MRLHYSNQKEGSRGREERGKERCEGVEKKEHKSKGRINVRATNVHNNSWFCGQLIQRVFFEETTSLLQRTALVKSHKSDCICILRAEKSIIYTYFESS